MPATLSSVPSAATPTSLPVDALLHVFCFLDCASTQAALRGTSRDAVAAFNEAVARHGVAFAVCRDPFDMANLRGTRWAPAIAARVSHGSGVPDRGLSGAIVNVGLHVRTISGTSAVVPEDWDDLPRVDGEVTVPHFYLFKMTVRQLLLVGGERLSFVGCSFLQYSECCHVRFAGGFGMLGVGPDWLAGCRFLKCVEFDALPRLAHVARGWLYDCRSIAATQFPAMPALQSVGGIWVASHDRSSTG